MVVQFVLKDEDATAFESILRAEYATRYEGSGAGTRRVVDPFFGKRDDLDRARERLRFEVTDWYKTNLPGVFSQALVRSRLPLCEFLIFDGFRPYGSKAAKNPWSWVGALGVDDQFGSWSSSDLSGLWLATRRWLDDAPNSMLIAMGLDDIRSAGWLPLGDRLATESQLQVQLNRMFAIWGVSALLGAYETSLRATRDEIDAAPSADTQSTIRRLVALQAQVLSTSADVSAVSADAKTLAETQNWFDRDLPIWHQLDHLQNPLSVSFTDVLRARILQGADRLSRQEHEIRELLMIEADSRQAISNLRLQRTFLRLNVVLLVVGAATLVVAGAAAWISWLTLVASTRH